MKRFFTAILIAMTTLGAMAQYSLHSASDGVKLIRANQISPAKVGTRVTGSDVLRIPAGGKAAVINGANKKIFQSTETGDIQVMDLVRNAGKTAGGHAGMVGRKMSFGRSGAKSSDATVYREKGMTYRSLATYDPEGQNTEMDAALIGRMLAWKMVCTDTVPADTAPVTMTHAKNMGNGLCFNIENPLEQPIYFNVVKIGGDCPSKIEISPLGQPAGCYVLLPQQTMTRIHKPAVNESEKHLIIMAPCQFDIDKVIDEVNKALTDSETPAPADLPVYVTEL